MTHAPPLRGDLHDSPRHSSTVWTPMIVAGITPVWPTMSRFGEVDEVESEGDPRERSPNASVTSERHRRLKGHRWRCRAGGHQLSSLPGKTRFLAAVEEVGDVRVLLGLGDVQLAGSACASVAASVVAGWAAVNAIGYGQPAWYSVIVASRRTGFAPSRPRQRAGPRRRRRSRLARARTISAHPVGRKLKHSTLSPARMQPSAPTASG